MLQRSRKTGKAWKIWKLKTPVYCGEGGKTPPFCPTLVPTFVASSLQEKLEKAALRRFMCPQLFWIFRNAGNVRGKCRRINGFWLNEMLLLARCCVRKVTEQLQNDAKNCKCWVWSIPKACQFCRSRHMLKNDTPMARFGVDAAENGPSKVWVIGISVYQYRCTGIPV